MICSTLDRRTQSTVAVKDLASLLVNTGFHEVTVDTDEVQVMYPTLMALLRDLQLLGESSALIHR